MARKAKIAIILSGCGVQDGSEIHEAVLTMLAIDRAGASYRCFAPNRAQHHVINHRTGEAQSESRNILIESARIARGAIEDLAQFHSDSVDALILPGGFGAAKNLSDFAMKGRDCTVDPEVGKAIRCLHAAGKPIGALCIAPAILAKVLGTIAVTVGQDAESIAAIEAMGAKHRPTDHGEIVIDHAARIVTTPCYMLDATISQVADGAAALVAAVLSLITP